MARYFTDEQKRAAIDLYFERRNSNAVVSELDYPPATALLKWVKMKMGVILVRMSFLWYKCLRRLQIGASTETPGEAPRQLFYLRV